MESAGNAVIDFGRFCTGFLVVMGVGRFETFVMRLWRSGRRNVIERMSCWSACLAALPVLLAHCALITMPAMAMSIVGGLLIYGTIISFTQFFREEQDFWGWRIQGW
jgi:hypothetical protein